MLTYAPYHLNNEKRQACAILEDELLDIADTLEKVEQTALAVCGDYFLRLPNFDPEREAKRIQQDFAFYCKKQNRLNIGIFKRFSYVAGGGFEPPTFGL